MTLVTRGRNEAAETDGGLLRCDMEEEDDDDDDAEAATVVQDSVSCVVLNTQQSVF